MHAFGSVTVCTVYNALHLEARAHTRAILDIACTSMSEGGLYAGVDIWLHAHIRLSPYMKTGTHGIACHTGLRKYGQAMSTARCGCGWDHVKPGQYRHTYGTTTPHRTVTTQFMGVTKGDPNWGHSREEVTHRSIDHMRNGYRPEGRRTRYWEIWVSCHQPFGLNYITHQLHQIWLEGHVAFMERPSLAGLGFGAQRIRVDTRQRARACGACTPKCPARHAISTASCVRRPCAVAPASHAQ